MKYGARGLLSKSLLVPSSDLPEVSVTATDEGKVL